ncbi:unnamed protein product, partial [Laminaria digitata]
RDDVGDVSGGGGRGRDGSRAAQPPPRSPPGMTSRQGRPSPLESDASSVERSGAVGAPCDATKGGAKKGDSEKSDARSNLAWNSGAAGTLLPTYGRRKRLTTVHEASVSRVGGEAQPRGMAGQARPTLRLPKHAEKQEESGEANGRSEDVGGEESEVRRPSRRKPGKSRGGGPSGKDSSARNDSI